jgi:hypothetical protein
MEAKLTRLTHKIAIQLHLVAESCTICSSRSRRPVRKLLDKTSFSRRTITEVLLRRLLLKPYKFQLFKAITDSGNERQ